jgi:hypothetical protein
MLKNLDKNWHSQISVFQGVNFSRMFYNIMMTDVLKHRLNMKKHLFKLLLFTTEPYHHYKI